MQFSSGKSLAPSIAPAPRLEKGGRARTGEIAPRDRRLVVAVGRPEGVIIIVAEQLVFLEALLEAISRILAIQYPCRLLSRWSSMAMGATVE